MDVHQHIKWTVCAQSFTYVTCVENTSGTGKYKQLRHKGCGRLHGVVAGIQQLSERHCSAEFFYT